MNKTKYKILFIFTLSGIAVMTACGNTTESSAAPTPANSSVVLGESTEQSEASVDNDSITELDFSNINGFGVSAEYGDPYAKGKNWDITDETAITEFRQLLNESLSYAVDENTAKNGMLSKGTAQWKVSDGKEYSIIVRQTTADAYNVKINKCYYNVPEDLINSFRILSQNKKKINMQKNSRQSENLSGEVLLRGSISYRCFCFFQHIYYIISIFVFVKLAA